MAKSWKEIVALPAYQNMPTEKQERMRQAYFDEVVAPSLSFSDLADARSAFDEATAPPPPPKQNASFAGDVVDLTQRGFLNSVGGVLDFAGADTGAQYFYDQGEKQRATMTPETQAALEQPLFDDEGDYYLGEGASSPRAWLAQGIETLGGSALPIPGGALAKAALRPLFGLGKAAQAVKGGLVAEGLGARAATRQARELAPDWRDTAAMVGGYGGLEGAVSAGLTEQQVREQVLAKPQADLEATPEYWQAMQETGGDPAAARTLLAENLGKEAGLKVFGPTAVLGAGAGRYYDKLIGGAGSGSRLVNAGKGAVTEALEEAPQSLAETLATNSTLQAVDPGLELGQGAVANMLTGATMGAAVGGVMGGVLPRGRVEERGPLSRAANQGQDAAELGLPPAPPAPEVAPDPLAEGKVAEQAAKTQAAQAKAEGVALKNHATAAKLAAETGDGAGQVGPDTDAEALSLYDRLMAEAEAQAAAREPGPSQGEVLRTVGDPNVLPSAQEQADQARFQEQLRQATAGTGAKGGADGSLPVTDNPADQIRQNHIALMRKGLAGGKLTKKQAAAPDWAYVREAVPLGAPMPTDAEILQLLNDFHNGVPVPGAPGVAADVSPAPGVTTDEGQQDVGSLQNQGQGQAANAQTSEVTAQPPSAWAALGLPSADAGLTTTGQGEGAPMVQQAIAKGARLAAEAKYAERYQDRINRMQSATTPAAVEAILTQEEYQDPERHFVGTHKVEQAAKDAKRKLAEEATRVEAEDKGEWVTLPGGSRRGTRGEMQAEMEALPQAAGFEYRLGRGYSPFGSNGQDNDFVIERRKVKTAASPENEDLAQEPGASISTVAQPAGATPAAPKEYRYALFNRPAGLGATPKNYLRVEPRPDAGQDHHATARHGVIVYDRPLTLEEMQGFELQPLVDGAEREALAEAVAGKLARYRDKVLAMADEDDFDQVRSSIANRFERFHPENPSIGDFDAFVQQVVGKLRATAAKKAETVEPAPVPSAAEVEPEPATVPSAAEVEAERLARMQSAEATVRRAALGSREVQLAALRVARGDEGMQDTLRLVLRQAIGKAIGAELNRVVKDEGDADAMSAVIQSLGALTSGAKGADGLNPEVFTDEALTAWAAEAVRAARRVVREERKAEHEQVILAAATGAWKESGFWQPDPDEMVKELERGFVAGWHHALEGGTGSNLAPGATDSASRIRRMGYDAAVAWLGTADGQAFVTGAKPRKMEGVGERLRRRQDERKARLAAIDLSQDDQAAAFVAALDLETERAELFPTPEVGEGQASPGLRRYVLALRQQLLPFKEWMSSMGYGGRGKYVLSASAALEQAAKEGQTQREALRDKAAYYIEQVTAFGQLFAGAKTVAEAAAALEAWARVDGAERGSGTAPLASESLEFKRFVGRIRVPSEDGKGRLASITRKSGGNGAWILETFLPGGMRTRVFGQNEGQADDTTRNKPLKRERFDRVERVGEDYRQGRNIDAAELTAIFGLKGVTYGQGVTAKQRQDHTNYAFDAFMDLAKLLGIEPRHIGMGGKLTFAFGALGHGRHSAHYTPDNNGQGQAINLTNTRGDGAVAHEWLHALDWNLRPGVSGGAADQVDLVKDMIALLSYGIPSDTDIEVETDRFLSGRVRWQRGGRGATPEDHAGMYLDRTIRDLESIIERGVSSDRWTGAVITRFKNEAKKLGEDYWGNPAELLARAGEAWVYDRLAGANNYLVSDWVEALKVTAPTYRGQPYPSGEERAWFNDAFERLLKEIDWTDTGPVAKGRKVYQILDKDGHIVRRETTREAAEAWVTKARQSANWADELGPDPIREMPWPGEGWADSPLKAKARDAIARARQLQADLTQRSEDLKARQAAEALSRAAGEAAAVAQREQEEAARIRAEWEALQAELTPPPVPSAVDGKLSAEALSALFDEAEAEVEEERQEAPREPTAPPPDPTTPAPETGPAFVDDPNAPVIALARQLAAMPWTRAGADGLSWRELGVMADAAFGGTKADGKYSPKDAYDALEMALNLVVSQPRETFAKGATTLAQDAVYRSGEILRAFERLWDLDNQIPTQTNRTAEQDEFQQFSTPHPHAALMARVANINADDVVLEPSAGSGNLATMAQAAGPRAVVVNELAPRRAAILKALGFSIVYTENAEQLGNILGPRGLKPTVVIMNPPFSASAGRVTGMRDNRIGAKHVEEALKLLAPGGRAVILIGRGYTRGAARLNQHWAWLLKNFNVRANLGLDGSQYKKFGTSFDNRLVVIDKTGPTLQPDAILNGEGLTVAQALEQLETIRNDRIHVGGRYGSESGGGQVAAAGGLPDGAVATAPAATGAVGDGQPEAVGLLGGGGGDAAAAPGAAVTAGTGGRGRGTGGHRRPHRPAATGATGTDAGGRGGAGAGADVLQDRGTDPGLDAGTAASLSQAAAEFAKHGVEGINEALTGLAALFGGGNRLRSFPGGIDEETYAQAKPHFEKAAQAFLAAGNDFKEFFKVLIRAFGSGIKPYAMRFAQDWQERQIPAAATDDGTPANEPLAEAPEAADAPKTLGDSLYEGYSPNPVWAGLGAKPHPGMLVESAAMAAVNLPELAVKLQFPREVYTEGRLSAAQLDAVAYTEQAHQRILPNGARQGFFIGDGTGVGKGREVAGILYHNWLQGQRKAVWLSVNNDLYKDSVDYLKAVAGSELGLFNLGKVQAEGQITAAEGVAFVTYPMLRGGGQGKKDEAGKKISEGQKRIDQLVTWLGPDFDGVIAFDESHNMGNPLEMRGTRGAKKASQQALMGVALQQRLPKARVVYVSATGATEPTNLGYLTRLGLWGEGTPFADVMAFVNNIAGSGLAAMEVVAKDMKALGVYLARSLPFHEVSYAQLEHELTADQREMYDTIAGAWQVVLRDVNAALKQTEQKSNGKAKGAALAQFWGSQQRFFNQMLTSLQMPSLIKSIEADLAAGRAPILQFVNTNEASQEREANKLAAEERDLEELDITPRQVLLQFLENAFPVTQYETYTDDNGNQASRPVMDSQGNPVENIEAVAARDALMDRVAQLRFPDNPIDIVVGHFGSAQVAEITGRKRRFVRDAKTGKVTEEKRNDAIRGREVDEFQGDRRRLLVFSDKGGTGKSYHADLNVKNQRKRVHYVVQPGWRADKAIQGLGRSHRTNQAQAPHVVLVTTNLRGHRRFVASIARRMDQLGALTKGQRKTGGQGLFTENMNLESQWADGALDALVRDVLGGRIEGVNRATLSEAMGLTVETEGGRKKQEMPTIQQFLNRILVLEADRQNQLFDAFAERLATQLEQARLNGTLDRGLENIQADKVRKVSEREVYQHPRTGATTRLVELELTQAIEHWTFEGFMEAMLASNKTPFFVRNRRSGRVWGLTPGADVTEANGRVKRTWRRWGTQAWSSTPEDRYEIGDPGQPGIYPLNRDKWEFLELPAAAQAWAADYAVAPKEATSTTHLLSGVLLPIWDRLTDAGVVRVQRALTDEGEMVLGRRVANDMVDQILMRLTGSSRTAGMTPQDIFEAVLNRKATAVLANNWRLVPRRVADNPRIELTGAIDYREGQLLQEQGVIFERIGYQGRYFIPTEPTAGVAVLTRVLANRPVIELVGDDGGEGPVFSKSAGQAGAGASPAAVRAAVNRITAKWARAPGMVVFTGMDDPQVDAAVRREYAKQTRERLAKDPNAAADQVDAFYFRGRVYLNTETVRDYADLERALRHEALGHAGLRGLFGPVLNGILDQVIAGQGAVVAAKAKARGLDMAKLEEARTAAEEVLAELAETRPQLGVVRRAVALIRRLLREMGVTLALSDADLIAEYILPARDFIERGRRQGEIESGLGALSPAVKFAITTQTKGREVAFTAEQPLFDWLGVDPGTIWADAINLRNKHPDMFVTPEEVAAHISYVLSGANYAMQASKPKYTLLVARQDTDLHRSAVIEFSLRGGKYRVRNAQFMSEQQLYWKIKNAENAGVEVKTSPVAVGRDSTMPGRSAEAAYPQEPSPPYDGRPTGPNKNLVGADDEVNSDIRFSLSPASGGSPLGDQGGKAYLNKTKTALGHRWTQALGSREGSPLMALTLRQLSEVGAKWLPGIETYNRLRARMETRRNVMMEESGRLGDALDSWSRRHADEARQVWDLANDSTLAQVDPSDYQVLRIPLQLGPGREFLRNWAATAENVAELKRRAKVWRASSSTREREAGAYYAAAATKLAKAVRMEAKRRAALPALQQRWAALSDGKTYLDANGAPFATEVAARAAQAKLPAKTGAVYLIETVPGGWAIQEMGGQQAYTRMRDLYKKRSGEMMEALIERLNSLESLDEASKAALAARIRAEFENPLDEKGNPRIGPYFPLQRFGNFFLFARRYPEGEPRTFQRQDGEPFPSEKAAWSASAKRADLRDLDLKVKPLEDGTGFVLEERGEEGFWLFESPAERSQAAAELKGEGWTVIRQGLTQEASRALEGVSEGFMADAVTKLKAQGSLEEADTLYQMYLQTLQQMSIRKRFIHRKGTKGYTADVLRSYGWNMVRQAHQISKLEGMPPLEKLLRDIEEGIKTGAQDQPDQDTTRQTALLVELKKRHEAIATPDGSAITNMLSALGFVFYLGVSPAAALVNLSQVPIVAFPALAARYGSWGAAAKGLTTAFVDVARGFSPAVMKGFVTGRPLPSDAANLNDEERAAFVAWSESGVRDRTQAHNLAGIAEADSLLNGPTMNRVMGAVSSLFHAAEVLNRDATLLAAFRLARAKGIDPQTAMQQAEVATWESHFDYSNANRARLMQGNVAKVVLMFKNYAQHVLYFMGRNLFLWAKGESKEVRQEARTKFAGMMGMTALFAGVAGLPISGVFVMANALQALFGDDDEPWDAEIEFRNWLAATFPDPVAGMIDRGAVTRLSGLDFASRVSIRDLLWRAPDRDLDGKGLYQHVVEQLLGPIGGLAARPFTMADEVAEGNWARAAEAAVPKFARDLLQAGRFGVEGVTTRQGYPVMTAEELSSYELFWKAMGMQPDALAVRWDANSATKLYEGRIVNRRKALITAAALAMIHKDAATLKVAREEIAVFNRANPEVKIGLDTLTRSVRGRNTMRERAQFGVLVNPKLAGLRETAGGFGYPTGADEEGDQEE